MKYRVTVLLSNQLHSEDTVADWTAVRQFIGDAFESVVSGLSAIEQETAYGMSLPPLQRALTRPETQETVDTSGAWATTLGTVPLSLRVTRV